MQRSELRRKLLFHFTLIAIVLVLASAKFIGSHLLTAAAVEKFEAGSGRAADLDPLRQTNIYEHYKVFLNSGDLHYQRSRFRAAENEFRRAVWLADGSAACRARFNLVLAIEAQGKALIAERALLSGKRLLERAIATMERAPECFRSSGDGKDGIAERFQEQRAALRAEIERSPGAQPVEPQEQPAENAAPPDSSDLKQIEKDQAEASREAQENRDERDREQLPPYDGPTW